MLQDRSIVLLLGALLLSRLNFQFVKCLKGNDATQSECAHVLSQLSVKQYKTPSKDLVDIQLIHRSEELCTAIQLLELAHFSREMSIFDRIWSPGNAEYDVLVVQSTIMKKRWSTAFYSQHSKSSNKNSETRGYRNM